MATPTCGPRRVSFGETCILEVALQGECSDDRTPTTIKAIGGSRDHECTPLNRSLTHDGQDPKTSISVVRLEDQSWRSTDYQTSTTTASSDEDEEEDIRSLIHAYDHFDSARTKARSLVPRPERDVELDLRQSAMWTRRMACSSA
eukprot:TRINITY_DN79280_c0_g1_i1.p1 TRINITY_DN79280_c0_g1~~TRINITY_DN79280_c0_g1_i1.p1  ORF type:complete len:155 (-),score=17.69 TRINITY_DN79280_c0_g1_i1:73-507(-)